ncbi:MAG: TIGR04338 family metallohydrolase [Candidatus Nanopelagicales bacterium]
MSRDAQRSAVYAAEDQLARLLARGGRVDFFGSSLTLPVERRFADVDSVQRYVEAVLDVPAIRERWSGLPPVRARTRAGGGRAHYEAGDPAVIAIPLAGPVEARWAARETVVLHEIAHHLTMSSAPAPAASPEPPHGPRFCGTLLFLLGVAIGPEAALALRAFLDGAGVPVEELAVEAAP